MLSVWLLHLIYLAHSKKAICNNFLVVYFQVDRHIFSCQLFVCENSNFASFLGVIKFQDIFKEFRKIKRVFVLLPEINKVVKLDSRTHVLKRISSPAAVMLVMRQLVISQLKSSVRKKPFIHLSFYFDTLFVLFVVLRVFLASPGRRFLREGTSCMFLTLKWRRWKCMCIGVRRASINPERRVSFMENIMGDFVRPEWQLLPPAPFEWNKIFCAERARTF